MKTLPAILLLITTLFSMSCNSQSSTQPVIIRADSDNSDKIEAYYFHFTARFVTCKTIEADTKKNLEALYPELIRTGLGTFQSLNLDEEPSRTAAKQLGVSGQTLLLVKGAALGTSLAFMMAVIGLSLPEMIILRKVLKLPLIFTFIGVIGTGIILVGYIFNIFF